MYFILIVILLALFFWLVSVSLKSAAKGIKFLLFISTISILAVSILAVLSYHYKEINPSVLILALISGFGLVVLACIRRLR